MSTTRLWGEPDNRNEVRHAQMRPLHGVGVITLKWNWGEWMYGRFKVWVSFTSSVYISQVWLGKRKWVPHGCGMNQNTRMKSDVRKRDPSMEWVQLFWGEIGWNGWPEGSKFRGALPVQCIEPSDGVNGNEYHTVVGWTRQPKESLA